jgi:thioredoxin-like negative regulator of GroEL
MEIAQILKRLDDSRSADQGIKTASATPATAPTTDALRTALRSSLAVGQQEKTAAVSTTSPTGDLLKMAEDLTNAEEEAMMKQASIYGAAMCDGFMNRFGQYESAAMEVAPAPKTAAVQQPVRQDNELEAIKTAAADPGFQKFASENPELVKEAFDLGYQQEMGKLVKTAEEDFQQGYNDTMREVHKIASEVYKQGAVTINQVIRSLQG